MIDTYLNQTAHKLKSTGYDRYGKPILDSKNSFKCRAQGTKRRFLDANGQEFPADLEMWVGINTKLGMDDGVLFEGVKYRVVQVATKRGFTGAIDHYKLLLQVNKEENG